MYSNLTIKQDRWTGTDGKNYSKIKVVAEHVEYKPRFKEISVGVDENDASIPAEDTESAVATEKEEVVAF